jgi:hypothetical protein
MMIATESLIQVPLANQWMLADLWGFRGHLLEEAKGRKGSERHSEIRYLLPDNLLCLTTLGP